jgi:hypothetical protein
LLLSTFQSCLVQAGTAPDPELKQAVWVTGVGTLFHFRVGQADERPSGYNLAIHHNGIPISDGLRV